jgi:hypothetical protein
LCPPSHAPSRGRSPLVPEAVRPTVDPSATFGSFLVPHKDGKGGEVLLGSKDAKKEKKPKKGSKTVEKTPKKGSQTPEEGGTPDKKSRHRRVFSRMASISSLSSLRKRGSRADLSKAIEDDVPDVPLLPRVV